MPRGHILTLDVAASHRRLGLGTRLLARSEKELAARGVTEMVLEDGGGKCGRRGILAAGTAIVRWARLKRYYLRRLDAFEMRKRIGVRKAG